MARTAGADAPVLKEKSPPPKVTVRFNVPKNHKLHKSVDVGKMRVGHSHRVGVNGRVTSAGQDEYGKNFEMEVDGMDMGQEKKGTMMADLAKLKKSRTMRREDVED